MISGNVMAAHAKLDFTAELRKMEIVIIDNMQRWRLMLLYHGSNVIVETPRLLNQTRGLDFGSGFYLTTNEEQAARFSEIVLKRQKSGFPAVSVYEFDAVVAEKVLVVRKFDSADAEWLRFVVENRAKFYQGKNYDVVIGAVANDRVMPTVLAYMNGFLNEEATLITLKTSKLVDQICLKTEAALSQIKFVRAYEVNRGPGK